MRQEYPSDITREQFEKIRPMLESVRRKTHPRKVDLYDAFCGVLYILKTGCQWRSLPHEYPKWRTVHAYFEIWTGKQRGKRKKKTKQPTLLDEVLKKIGWRGAYTQWTERIHEHAHR